MKYWGGKLQIGKQISETMLDVIEDDPRSYKYYYEPFLGMGGVYRHMVEPLRDIHPEIEFLGSDINRASVNFWNELQDGWRPMSTITIKEFKNLKRSKELQSADHAFVGYSTGFYGQYFKGNPSLVDMQSRLKSAHTLVQQAYPSMKNVKVWQEDFFDIPRMRNTILYCDPPYMKSPVSNGLWSQSDEKFSTRAFWDRLEELSDPKLKNLIFVSESSAPKPWRSIWEKDITNYRTNKRREHLYVRSSELKRIYG